MPDELLDVVQGMRARMNEAEFERTVADGRLAEVGDSYRAWRARAEGAEALLRQWESRFCREAKKLSRSTVEFLAIPQPCPSDRQQSNP